MFQNYGITCINLMVIYKCILYIQYIIHLEIAKKKSHFHIDESPGDVIVTV